jgi:hypothetical protein
MAGALYEATFAVLTRTMGTCSKQAIIAVTLVAGFAGTVAFPGIHTLVGLVGWRGTALVLAGIVGFITVPLIWVGSRTAEAFREHHQTHTTIHSTGRSGIVRNPIFLLLAVGFAAIALNHGVLITHLLPLLDERGIPSGVAVFAAALIGPMQVAGRLTMLAVERRVSSLGSFVACFIALGFASLALLGASALPLLVIGFVLLQGSGHGVTSIMRPVITADLLGHENYGLIAGALAVPFLLAAAAAPSIAAVIWGVGGYDLVIGFAGAAVVLGLISLLAAAKL